MRIGLAFYLQHHRFLWRPLAISAPLHIGRGPSCDVCLPNFGLAPLHAVVTLLPERGAARVQPQAPAGLWVDQTWHGEAVSLLPGAQVALVPGGALTMVVEPWARVEARPKPAPPTLYVLQRQAVVWALQRSRGNRRAAARTLGISRSTMHRKLDEFDLRRVGLAVRGRRAP